MRVAFLLHNVFGIGFDEIAVTIQRSPAACSAAPYPRLRSCPQGTRGVGSDIPQARVNPDPHRLDQRPAGLRDPRS